MCGVIKYLRCAHLIQMLFSKVDLDISFTKQARRGKYVLSYGPIHYYTVLGNPFPFKLIKAWKPDLVRWVEITGTQPAGPHRDHGITTTLNCYMDAPSGETKFWREGANSAPFRVKGAVTSNGYVQSTLDFVDSFKAFTGDAYLLNVSEIHSVEKEIDVNRRFIQLSWNTVPFDQVLKLVQTPL
jgi:hypothetical protein